MKILMFLIIALLMVSCKRETDKEIIFESYGGYNTYLNTKYVSELDSVINFSQIYIKPFFDSLDKYNLRDSLNYLWTPGFSYYEHDDTIRINIKEIYFIELIDSTFKIYK